MFNNILIPTDGSDLSKKAILCGVQLAKLTKAKVTVLAIRAPFTVTAADAYSVVISQDAYERETKKFTDRALEQASVEAEAAGVAIEPVQEVHGEPYRAIIDYATGHQCDLIVMASHGRRGISSLLLGSETTKVLTHSKIPVLVYR